MARYPNLPGVEVKVQDGGLVLAQEGVSPRLLIIAPSRALNAPQEPAWVRQESDLALLGYGGMYVNGDVNPIAAHWKAAQDAGNRSTYLSALKGDTAKEQFLNLHREFTGVIADFPVDHVVLQGVTVSTEVDVVKADFEDPEDQDNFPSVAGVVRYGELVQGQELVMLPAEITLGTNDTIVINDGAADKTVTLAAKVYDGTEGNDLEKLADDLTAELEVAVPGLRAVVEGGRIDLIGAAAFTVKASTLATLLKLPTVKSERKESRFGEITKGSFARLLSEFVTYQSMNSTATLGYIGVPALQGATTLANVRQHAKDMLALDTRLSGFVQIVDAEGVLNLQGGATYFMNGATAYAATVAALSPQSAPTAKRVRGLSGLRYTYGASQRNALTGHRLVTFYVRNGQILVTDGITSAPQIFVGNKWVDSDYTRLSTVRITNYVAQVIRNVCERFIGEPNEMPQYNAMNAAIRGEIEAAVRLGVIQDARVTVVPGRDLGSAVVSLRVLPQFETRDIEVNIALSTPDSF